MAATAATLAKFFPKDAELGGAPCRLTKWNGVPALVFPKDSGNKSPVPRAFFDDILSRATTIGYSGTTGIKVVIGWSVPSQLIAGAARFGASIDLKGATDLPLANVNAVPADLGTNEVLVTTNVNSTTPGGMNYTTISLTIANIKNGQTTSPAGGDFFRLQVRRAVESAADTIAADVHVHSVELYDY